MRQPDADQGFGEAHQGDGKAPERFSTLGVFQKYRQAREQSLSALNQIEWPGQRQLSGIACDKGLPVSRRVQQQIVTDGLFVAGEWHDLADYSAGRQLQRGHRRIEPQHLLGHHLEIDARAMAMIMAMAKQFGQDIGHRRAAFDLVPDRLCTIGALAGHLFAQ